MLCTCTLYSLQRNINIIMGDTVSLKHHLDYIKCKIAFALQLSKTIIDTVTQLISQLAASILNFESRTVDKGCFNNLTIS